ncbi:MAG: EamA family transporter RarD [Planctomycetes bacterium]|nr:EamA family transporter RarD [Planctomycetota bacterium]
MQNATREGMLYGLAAYLWWGLVPLYFRWLGPVQPLDILAHRIVWSAVLLAAIITFAGRWPETLRCLRTPKIVLPLTVSAILVAYNWLMYIVGVHLQIIVQASLGYFILPLVSVLFAMLIFHETMRPLQNIAVLVALLGVLRLTWLGGEFPWLALALAVSFSAYGMIRKQVEVDGLIGLTVETFVLLPIAAGYLAIGYCQRMEIEDADLFGKLMLSGIVTAIPLLCFGEAARRLPFATLGFMQFISPTVQMLLAITIFEETATGGWLGYTLVWSALVIFSIDSYLRYRRDESPG